MKTKTINLFMALMLVALVFVVFSPSAPVATATPPTPPNPTFVKEDVDSDGVKATGIGWSPAQPHNGSNHSVHVTTSGSGATTRDYAVVAVPTNFTLDASTTMSYWGLTMPSRLSERNLTFHFAPIFEALCLSFSQIQAQVRHFCEKITPSDRLLTQ